MPIKKDLSVDQNLAKRFVQFCDEVVGGTQSDQAEVCECTQKHISELRSGKKSISADIIRHLYKKKDLNIVWFFDGVGPKLRRENPKENLVSNVSDLKAEILILSGLFKNTQSMVKKLYTDFYAKEQES